jgi:hypothetical protein
MAQPMGTSRRMAQHGRQVAGHAVHLLKPAKPLQAARRSVYFIAS